MKNVLPTLLVGVIVLFGCQTTPPARFYTLDTRGAAIGESAAIAVPTSRRIEIVSVQIPELWDRPQLVISKGGNEIGISEFHRWAVPLKVEVPRVVGRDVAHLLRDPNVWLRGDFPGSTSDLRVQATIERIEALESQNVQLDASWIIRPATGGAGTVGRAEIVEPMDDRDYDAMVAALRRAILKLSQALAHDIAAVADNLDVR